MLWSYRTTEITHPLAHSLTQRLVCGVGCPVLWSRCWLGTQKTQVRFPTFGSMSVWSTLTKSAAILLKVVTYRWTNFRTTKLFSAVKLRSKPNIMFFWHGMPSIHASINYQLLTILSRTNSASSFDKILLLPSSFLYKRQGIKAVHSHAFLTWLVLVLSPSPKITNVEHPM